MKQYYWAKEFPCTKDGILDGRAFEYLESIRRLCFLWENPGAGYYTEGIEFIGIGPSAYHQWQEDGTTYTQTWSEWVDSAFPPDSDNRCHRRPEDIKVWYDGELWCARFTYDDSITYKYLNSLFKNCQPPEGGPVADNKNAAWVRCPSQNQYYNWDANCNRTKIHSTDITHGYWPSAYTEYCTTKMEAWKWLPKNFDPYEVVEPKALIANAEFWDIEKSYTSGSKVIFDNKLYEWTDSVSSMPGYSPSGWFINGWQPLYAYNAASAWTSQTYSTGSVVELNGYYFRANGECSYRSIPVIPPQANEWEKIGITDSSQEVWSASSTYQKGDKVIHNGKAYVWGWDSFVEGTEPKPPSENWIESDGTAAAWNNQTVYSLGDKVNFFGKVYEWANSLDSTIPCEPPVWIQGWDYTEDVYTHSSLSDYDENNTYLAGEKVRKYDSLSGNAYYVFEAKSSIPANYPPAATYSPYNWQCLGTDYADIPAYNSGITYAKSDKVVCPKSTEDYVWIWTFDSDCPEGVAPDSDPDASGENPWQRIKRFTPDGYRFQSKEIEPRARHFTRPEFLGAQYSSFDVYSSSQPGSFAQTVQKNQYAITESPEPPESNWSLDDPQISAGQISAEVKMAAALQNYIEYLLCSNSYKIKKSGSWISNYEYAGYSFDPSDPNNPDSRYASFSDYFWGCNESGFEKCLEIAGSYDYYFDWVYPYIPGKVYEYLQSISKTPAQSEMNADIIQAVIDFVNGISGTWRKTWKYSLGRAMNAFQVASGNMTLGSHYGQLPPQTGDTLSWINSWSNNFSMTGPAYPGYDSVETQNRHGPTQRIEGHAEYEIDRLVNAINEMWKVLNVKIGIVQSPSVKMEAAYTKMPYTSCGLSNYAIQYDLYAQNMGEAVQRVEDDQKRQMRELINDPSAWGNTGGDMTIYRGRYDPAGTPMASTEEYTADYDEENDQWINWGYANGQYFSDYQSICRIAIKRSDLPPQCDMPSTSFKLHIGVNGPGIAEEDILNWRTTTVSSFGSPIASFGATVDHDTPLTIKEITFPYASLDDEEYIYLYLWIPQNPGLYGPLLPENEPYYYFDGTFANEDVPPLFTSQTVAKRHTSRKVTAFSCGIHLMATTEVYLDWDWNNIPDSVWRRFLENPELVDTLEIVDDKPPLPNPPEWHFEPEISEGKTDAYEMTMMAKIVDDVPFAGKVYYKLKWNDIALSQLTAEELPQWQETRFFEPFTWTEKIEVQNDIWNRNLAAWQPGVIAKDESGNETQSAIFAEIAFDEDFDLGLDIFTRLVNPDAQPDDSDYGLKEIVFDALWDGDTGFESFGKVPDWTAGQLYLEGQYVKTSDGIFWKCTAQHTSTVDNEPPNGSFWICLGDDETNTVIDWDKNYDWDFKFECTNSTETIDWTSTGSSVKNSRAYTYVYKTSLTDQQLADEIQRWQDEDIRFRSHIRYRVKADQGQPENDWLFEFIGGWRGLS